MPRSLWAEPRPPGAPPRSWRDWALAGVFCLLAVLEGLTRPDLPGGIVAVVLVFALAPTLLFRRSQRHITRVVKDPAAVRASDELLMRLTGHQDLRRQLHVTPAANAMMHAHQDILPLVLHEPFITCPHALIHSGTQLLPVALQRGEFLLKVRFPLAHLGHLSIGELFGFIRLARQPDNFLLRRLGLLHQTNLLILDAIDIRLARVDLMGQGAILFVLARLQLLIGVFLDLRFLRLHV